MTHPPDNPALRPRLATAIATDLEHVRARAERTCTRLADEYERRVCAWQDATGDDAERERLRYLMVQAAQELTAAQAHLDRMTEATR